MHPRAALRLTVKNTLAGRTLAGNNVECSRKVPISQEPSALLGNNNETARIIVWTRNTKSQVFDESPRRYKHDTEVIVECIRQLDPPDGIDDSLDAFEDQVLRVLLVDDTLGGLVDDFQLSESTSDYGDVGDRIIGGTAITFRAIYYTTAPLPDTEALDDLKTLDTGYNLSGLQPDERDRARTFLEDLDA